MIESIGVMTKMGSVFKEPAEQTGNFMRLWGICVRKSNLMAGPIVVLSGSSLSLEVDSSDPGKKCKTLERVATEQLFDAALYQFSVVLHHLGVCSIEISWQFLFDVAYVLRTKHREDFWTCQEYLIECLDLLDRGRCKIHEVASFDRSLMLANAREFGIKFKSAADRKAGASASSVGAGAATTATKVWNNECQPCSSSARPCPYFNGPNGPRPHDKTNHLDRNGKCVFRHVCDKWVSDKGPNGRCLQEHPRSQCTNPNKCDSPVQ